ncbi:murein DD-endopeptidase MepM/ murein hydrolase activator NlpD [Anaerotaenia torta]|uniref:peptidoglycan DD-metalloendopeptidase family protein n=1 Tax=Anaerotaenia torta TaxID=433293 RepID=UPI003D1DA70D
MKKNKFTEFLKGKGYYMLLFVGVVAIAAVAVIGSQLSANQEQRDNEFVDLNEMDNNIAAEDENMELADNNPISEGIVNSEGDTSSEVASNDEAANIAAENVPGQDVADNSNMIEYEGYDEDNVPDASLAQAGGESSTASAGESMETSTATAQNEPPKAAKSLSFDVDRGLMWPVQGNIIMDYSMDHTIYYATLMRYQCNPALIIDAEVGTEVKAAAAGKVTAVDLNNEETGVTVTMDIGDGYSVVYGQLAQDMSLEVGDLVEEGEVIGTINAPTKYYSVEGSNLYFMVKENDQTINPMLLLR